MCGTTLGTCYASVENLNYPGDNPRFICHNIIQIAGCVEPHCTQVKSRKVKESFVWAPYYPHLTSQYPNLFAVKYIHTNYIWLTNHALCQQNLVQNDTCCVKVKLENYTHYQKVELYCWYRISPSANLHFKWAVNINCMTELDFRSPCGQRLYLSFSVTTGSVRSNPQMIVVICQTGCEFVFFLWSLCHVAKTACIVCPLAPPTSVGCNATVIKTNLRVSPAHVQPYTWICCHIEEAPKTPS